MNAYGYETKGHVTGQLVATKPEHAGAADEAKIIYDQSTDRMYYGNESAWVRISKHIQAHINDLSTGNIITDPTNTPLSADNLRDDLVLNTIPSLETILNSMGVTINYILAALEENGILAFGTPPSISAAETDTTGEFIILTFDMNMIDPTGHESDFIVMVNGVQDTVTACALYTLQTQIILTLSTFIVYGDVVTVTYLGD